MLVPSPGGCKSWGRIQQPETPSRSPSWYQEYMYLGHHPPLSLSSLARSWIRRQTPRIRVSTPMWDASIESSLLTFCTMMSPNWIQTCILSNTTKKKMMIVEVNALNCYMWQVQHFERLPVMAAVYMSTSSSVTRFTFDLISYLCTWGGSGRWAECFDPRSHALAFGLTTVTI